MLYSIFRKNSINWWNYQIALTTSSDNDLRSTERLRRFACDPLSLGESLDISPFLVTSSSLSLYGANEKKMNIIAVFHGRLWNAEILYFSWFILCFSAFERFECLNHANSYNFQTAHRRPHRPIYHTQFHCFSASVCLPTSFNLRILAKNKQQ